MEEKETKRRGRPPMNKKADDRAEVHSLRLEAETLAGINDVKNAMSLPTIDKAIKAILDTFSMTQAKEAIPDRAAEIAEFEILCRKLLDVYTHSLVLCNDADARAQHTVSQLLASKDHTIMELQQAVSSQKENMANLEEELEKTRRERDVALKELETLKQTERSYSDMSTMFGDIQKQLGDLKSKFANS